MNNDFTDLLYDPANYVPTTSVFNLDGCDAECEAICDFVTELLFFMRAIGKNDFHNLYSVYEYFADIGLEEEI